MAKRVSPADYRAPYVDLDRRYFDRRSLRKIIAEARLSRVSEAPATLTRIAGKMNASAVWLQTQIGIDAAPSAAAEIRALKVIANRCAALRAMLPALEVDETGWGGPGVPEGIARMVLPHLRDLMPERLAQARAEEDDTITAEELFGAANGDDALVVLSQLLDLVEEAARRAIADRTNVPPAKPGTAVRSFVMELIGAYIELCGGPARRSRDPVSGKPGGPLIRFLQSCLERIGERVPAETLADWIGQYKKEQD